MSEAIDVVKYAEVSEPQCYHSADNTDWLGCCDKSAIVNAMASIEKALMLCNSGMTSYALIHCVTVTLVSTESWSRAVLMSLSHRTRPMEMVTTSLEDQWNSNLVSVQTLKFWNFWGTLDKSNEHACIFSACTRPSLVSWSSAPFRALM